MRRRIAVLTEDKFLFQKIYLILGDFCEVFSPEGVDYSADNAFIDIDTVTSEEREGAVLMSRKSPTDLSIPFSESELLAALRSGGENSAPLLRLGARRAYLKGREIRLTEVEFALLSELAGAKGNYVSRDALLGAVWGGDADGGVLNVYIHYLREKLEREGEKVIFSSRKQGYKIDAKYFGGRKSEEPTEALC